MGVSLLNVVLSSYSSIMGVSLLSIVLSSYFSIMGVSLLSIVWSSYSSIIAAVYVLVLSALLACGLCVFNPHQLSTSTS